MESEDRISRREAEAERQEREAVELAAPAHGVMSPTEFEISAPAPFQVDCPTCGLGGATQSVCSPIGADGKSKSVFVLEIVRECPEGHRWTETRERQDVCAHGRTCNVPCGECGRTWADVIAAFERSKILPRSKT